MISGNDQTDGEVPADAVFHVIAQFELANFDLERLHMEESNLHWTEDYEDKLSKLGDRRIAALETVYMTEPSTLAGLRALIELFICEDLEAIGGIEGLGAETVCRSALALLLSPPAATTA